MYSAIYDTRYPEAGSGLFAYMANIRFLASSVDSLSWLNYDIDFRQARESEPIGWAIIYNDLGKRLVWGMQQMILQLQAHLRKM